MIDTDTQTTVEEIKAQTVEETEAQVDSNPIKPINQRSWKELETTHAEESEGGHSLRGICLPSHFHPFSEISPLSSSLSSGETEEPQARSAPPPIRYPSWLVLAVEQCIHEGRNLPDTQEALWRENPDHVQAIYDTLRLGKLCEPESVNPQTLLASRMRRLRRPLPSRRKHGLTLTEIAARTGISRETLASLMEHHGYLEMVPYGGSQRRRLVTDEAFHAGLGHNVDASEVRLSIEGKNRTSVFPVFYEDQLPNILWTFDLDRIYAAAQAQRSKKAALHWLLDHHAYLPNAEIARISGANERTVRRARAAREQAPSGGDLRPTITCNGHFCGMAPESPSEALCAVNLSF